MVRTVLQHRWGGTSQGIALVGEEHGAMCLTQGEGREERVNPLPQVLGSCRR